jgi:hypothetical protein
VRQTAKGVVLKKVATSEKRQEGASGGKSEMERLGARRPNMMQHNITNLTCRRMCVCACVRVCVSLSLSLSLSAVLEMMK